MKHNIIVQSDGTALSDGVAARQSDGLLRVAVSVLAAVGMLWCSGFLSGAAAAVTPSAVGLSTVTAPSADQDDDDIAEWGVQPYAAEGTEARSDFIFELAKGESAADAIYIHNLSALELTLDVYGADVVLTDGGDISLADRATPVEDVGSWFEFEQEAVTIPAGEAVVVPFRVHAPDDATPGDHCGGVLAGLHQEPAQADDNNLVVDSRVGVWTCVVIEGKFVPSLQLSDVKTHYEPKALGLLGGTLRVTVTVTNNGNVRQSGLLEVSSSGPLGAWSDSIDIELPDPIPPGKKVTITREFKDVPPVVHVDTELTVTPRSASVRTVAPVVSASSGAWTAPWVSGVLVILVVGVARLVFHLHQRRQRTFDKAVAAAARKQGEKASEDSGAPEEALDAAGAGGEPSSGFGARRTQSSRW